MPVAKGTKTNTAVKAAKATKGQKNKDGDGGEDGESDDGDDSDEDVSAAVMRYGMSESESKGIQESQSLQN